MTDKNQHGEGSYEGTREYDERTKEFLDKKGKDMPQLARDAADALDGPEGDALRKAEEEAKDHGGETHGQS
ncbi:hypothetical protein [Novosphingobium sp.]|uniref:hypothetical protein n=1 Tax=Novosphingobium sp. TaxID=1874826 RepID=UPI0025E5B062|nr:hypothetical protein [Novosphingobium sp.]